LRRVSRAAVRAAKRRVEVRTAARVMREEA